MVTNKPSIKSLTKRMVKRVGGLDKAAEICGVSEQLVSNWQSDNHATTIIPIYHVRTLDPHAGDIYLQEWARSRGYELTPIEVQPTCATTIIKAVTELSRANNDLECEVLEAAEDLHISDTEKRRIRDRLNNSKDRHDQLERIIS